MDLAFVTTNELTDELMRRFDVAVFIGAKNLEAGHWQTYTQWASAAGPYAAVGLLERTKHDLINRLAAQTEFTEEDEEDETQGRDEI